MQTILKSFKKKLTNLTGSNRSLLLLRLSARQDLDLHELDHLNGNSSFSIIEKLISGKKPISLCQNIDSRNEKVTEAGNCLKQIQRTDKFIFDERGGKDLYVGWPFVKGKFSDGTLIRCPLLFFPVTLQLKENNWFLELKNDEGISFNKSFLLAYAHYNAISLADDFLESSFEEFSSDSQVFRTELYQLLKQSSVELNFNQDLFIDKLQNFENLKKEDFESKFKSAELKLFSEAVLGIFPQAGSYLIPDYDYLISKNISKNVEDFFSQRTIHGENIDAKKSNYDFISQVKEEQTFTPFKQDASQENALKAVKKGMSLVVEGPPGTGKSQLICNLISDFIARGKNVLLVCQKRAALDVVHERLKEKGVAEFIGVVHDFKNDRKNIFDQMGNQIERLDEYKYKNSSLDAMHLERNFLQSSRRIDQLTEELEEFKKYLFNESECGISVKELYLTSDPSLPTIDVKQEFKYFKSEEIQKFVKLIKSYLPYASKFERSDYIWKDRVSFKDFAVSDKKRLLEVLEFIPFYQTSISEKIREILGASLDMEDLQWLLDRQEKMQQLMHLLEDAKTYSNFVHLLNKNTDHDWLIIKEKQITECFKGSGIESSVPTDQLGYFQTALEGARRSRSNLFKWMRWKFFSKDKFLVKRVFVSNKLDWDKTGFEELGRKVDNRMNLEHNLTQLSECGWLHDVPDTKELSLIAEWIHYQQTAVAAKDILKDLRSLKDYLNIPSLSYKELKLKLNALIKVLNEVPGEKARWLEYITPRQLSKILEGFDFAIDLSTAIRKDFESLVEFDKMTGALLQYEKSIIEKLIKRSDNFEIDEANAIALFENSIKLEWIESIEMKYPVLRSVSSLKMEQNEKELQECIEEKLKLSKEILLMRAREGTYKSVEFNRLYNMITYRDLKHQVTKKKKIWPIRKLVSEFSEEIFQLVPCWMASPESVSAIFPMDQIFDLVIFDEASQCFSEKGIPSVFRGKQIVITGDTFQLSPSDLYQVRFEDEAQDIPDLEVDSLLDLGKKYLTEVKLTGHYRSKSLDLIDFSNSHFYKGKLQVLPDFSDVIKIEPSIKYLKVNGCWKKNTNEEEANEAINLVRNLLQKDPSKSIGIVTFNYKQQNLIQDLLEQEQGMGIPESLFVKNIENVQGDERDIIIFSIGYAPDESGKMMMQFGSLNFERGENRLNVAITRAKEKIHIITSIFPDQLKVEDLKQDGPKLFKKYLEYALNVSDGKFLPAPKLFNDYKNLNLLKRGLEKITDKLPFKLNEELPFADITIKREDEYVGLLLTDDDMYFQSPSAKEMHAYIPLSMLDRHWKFKKFYSRNYWENKDQLREDIDKIFGKHD